MATQKTINKYSQAQVAELKDKFIAAYLKWESLVKRKKAEASAMNEEIKTQKEYLDQLERTLKEAKENME